MALQRILLNENPGQEFSTIIDGERVVFQFRYNTKIDRFYFSVTASDVLLLQGRTLESNVDIFNGLTTIAAKAGALFAVDIDDRDREPTLENIASGDVRIFLQTGV